jgi:signal transduction histidine kinase
MLRGALAEMRTLLIELRPAALVGKPLNELLQTLVEANRIRISCPVELAIEGESTLPEDITIVFYRIAQEALRNIAKYAEAEEVHLSLLQDEDGVQLVVKDNGLGFEPDKVPPGHHGLSIMQERVDRIRGDLVIDSQPNQGTQIQASWSSQNGGQGVDNE